MNHLKKLSVLLLLVSCTGASAQTTYWWNDAVFYEVFVRSFKDSDGDGKGDFNGLIEKLDYLNDGDSTTHDDLGITAIWLMPIQQSPSYHGYDVTDYRTIEQDYGTNADFKNFIHEAHSRGIKVIVDYVMNHTSSQHPWFLEAIQDTSSRRDWYTWQATNPGNTGPWGQTVWHPGGGDYFYGIFWSGMPDLNYTTPAVETEMFDIAEFWLDSMDVDGFRLDAIKYIFENGTALEDQPETIQFWKDFKTHYKSVNPDALGVGEAWTSTDKVQQYADGDGLDYCFEFDLATAILNTTNSGNPTGLRNQMDEVMAAYPYLQFGTFLTNHDMNRVMNQLGADTEKAKLAANILLTLPGVPYIYYGEEIGMTGVKPDENIRKPLQWDGTTNAGFTIGTPWRAVNADYTVKNIELQQYEATSLWNNYRKLIALRNDQNSLRKGDYINVTSTVSSVFTFLRQYQDENIIVAVNTGASDVTNVQLSATGTGIAPGNYTLVELQGGDPIAVTVSAGGDFSGVTITDIPARATRIYKLLDPAATTADVTFRVDMTKMIDDGDFDPNTETVDIIADFNNFGTSLTVLSDGDDDSIYTVTIPGLDVGSMINYKYRINGVNDGREEFSNSAYLREYIVLEGPSAVTDTYQKLDAITGIETESELPIDVYPVPASNELFIVFPETYTGTVHYQIVDLLGTEKVSASFNNTGQHQLSCNTLPTGVYLLTVTHNNVKQVFKIIVQK